jgi:hypothetical protein
MSNINILYNVLMEFIPDISMRTMTDIENKLDTYPQFRNFLAKKVERKPRTINSGKCHAHICGVEDGNTKRCHALVWGLEGGEPKRCTHKFTSTITDSSGKSINLCGIHSVVTNTTCQDCSIISGDTCFHQYRYEHLGTYYNRSILWSNEKCINDLEKVFGKSNLRVDKAETPIVEEAQPETEDLVLTDTEEDEFYDDLIEIVYEGKTYYKDSNGFLYTDKKSKDEVGIVNGKGKVSLF